MIRLMKPAHFLIIPMMLILYLSPVLAADTILQRPLGQSGQAAITFSASPLKAMTEIPFAISLMDDNGKAITDAKLSISMDMPAMPMPPNNPLVTWGNGAYRGTAIFTMAGAWQVHVTVATAEKEQQVVFDIEQVMMQ